MVYLLIPVCIIKRERKAKQMRTRDKIRDDAISLFCEIAEPLYNAQQKDAVIVHGDTYSLDDMVVIWDIEEKIIDLWFYTQSLQKKHHNEIERLQAEVERWKEIAQR